MKAGFSARRSDIAIGLEVKFPKKHRDELSITVGLILWTLHFYVCHLRRETAEV